MLQLIKMALLRITSNKISYIRRNKDVTMNLSYEKRKNLITFFLEKNGGTIERLELMKFIWMSDRLHLNKYGRTISKDSYCALPYGPIPSNILNQSNYNTEAFKILGYNISANTKFNADFFSKSDLEIMEYTWQKFNKIGSIKFSDYSHNFPEWKRFKKELEDRSYPKSSFPIEMQDFFEFPDINEFIDIVNEEEIKNSKIQYIEHLTIQDFLRS